MSFGLAELQAHGWLLRSEMMFDDLNEARLVARQWANTRGSPVGLASVGDEALVWRSDGGPLELQFLGRKAASTFPPKLR